MLIKAGYEIMPIFDDPLLMRQYERTIMRTNNLPENNMLLALAENLIIRIIESISDQKLQTKTVFNQ